MAFITAEDGLLIGKEPIPFAGIVDLSMADDENWLNASNISRTLNYKIVDGSEDLEN